LFSVTGDPPKPVLRAFLNPVYSLLTPMVAVIRLARRGEKLG